MSINEEFDELARRKLQERRMQYQEADWEQARVLLDQHRGRRRWTPWAWGAGLSLLVAVGFWRGSSEEHPAAALAEQASTSAPARTITAPDVLPHGSPDVGPGPKQQVSDNGMSGTAVYEADSMAPTQAAVHHVPHVVQTRTVAKASPSSPKPPTTFSRATVDDGRTPVGGAPRAVQNTGVAATNRQPGATLPASADPATAHGAGIQPVADVRELAPSSSIASGAPPVAARPTTAQEAHRAGMTGAVLTSLAPAPWGGERTGAPAKLHLVASDPSTKLPTASPLPAAAPIVPRESPWEITGSGGLFTSSSKYRGGNSAEWEGGLDQAYSAGFGAELMHTGRNISLGFGLHYGTYAERMRLDALDERFTSYQQYWYLAVIDTSILVITDTLPGTPPTYAGQSMNTAIQVLAQGTDTVVDRQHIRDARDAVNRVSYVEVPMLADVHVVQGRWSVGVRGGPTIGLLSTRRGAMPNRAGDGFTPFNGVAFRDVVLGYTARAYVRYRFNAAWSVGLEPALRGQLLNTLSSGDLERRSAAKGILLSLTYRLR